MTTITANNQKLIIVEVPEWAYEIGISHTAKGKGDTWHVDYRFQRTGNDFEDAARKFIDTGISSLQNPISLLGTITNGDIDFDVEGLVENWYDHSIGSGRKHFRNYLEGIDMKSASDSFLSLLSSKYIEYKGKKLVFCQRPRI